MPDMKNLTVDGTTFDIVDDESVHFTEQTLTPDQKAQARKNIGLANIDGTGSATFNQVNTQYLRIDGVGERHVIVECDRSNEYGTALLLRDNNSDPVTLNDVDGVRAYWIDATTISWEDGGDKTKYVYASPEIYDGRSALMFGDMNDDNVILSGIAEPQYENEAANKQYVDESIEAALANGGGSGNVDCDYVETGALYVHSPDDGDKGVSFEGNYEDSYPTLSLKGSEDGERVVLKNIESVNTARLKFNDRADNNDNQIHIDPYFDSDGVSLEFGDGNDNPVALCNIASPISDGDAANKQYVDTAVQGVMDNERQNWEGVYSPEDISHQPITCVYAQNEIGDFGIYPYNPEPKAKSIPFYNEFGELHCESLPSDPKGVVNRETFNLLLPFSFFYLWTDDEGNYIIVDPQTEETRSFGDVAEITVDSYRVGVLFDEEHYLKPIIGVRYGDESEGNVLYFGNDEYKMTEDGTITKLSGGSGGGSIFATDDGDGNVVVVGTDEGSGMDEIVAAVLAALPAAEGVSY